MSIRHRLLVMLSTGIIGILIAYGANYVGKSFFDQNFSMQALVKDLNIAMLQARRSEKDFFVRKKEDYLDKVTANVREGQDCITRLRHSDPNFSVDADKAQRLLHDYEETFLEVARDTIRLGLNEEQGLEGELRDAVHKVEEIVKAQKDDTLMAAMLMLRRREKDFMLRNDVKYLKSFEKDTAKMRELVQQSDKLSEKNKDEVLSLLSVYAKTFGAYVSARSAIDTNKKAFTETAHLLEEHIDVLSARVNEYADAVAQKITLSESVFGAVVVALLLGIGFFTARSILMPLTALQKCSRNVAGGDHGACDRVAFSAEFEELRRDLSAMVAHLSTSMSEAEERGREAHSEAAKAQAAVEEAEHASRRAEQARERILHAAGELRQVVEAVSSASEELSTQIEQSSRGAESQSSRVNETAAAMDEMNATVLEVARNASSAAGSADQARDRAREGASIVSRMVACVESAREKSRTVTTDMAALGQRAESIGQIMNVISDIADQTNLLALNAAIEAARAGEAGRGFAVVADEVRKLAEKTMTATKEVGEAIRGIQDGTRVNVENVAQTVKTIEDATTLAVTSGEVLDAIVALVECASDQVGSIATSAQQQSSASEQIHRSVEEINTISSETSQAMTQAATAVHDLARQSHTLRALMGALEG